MLPVRLKSVVVMQYMVVYGYGLTLLGAISFFASTYVTNGQVHSDCNNEMLSLVPVITFSFVIVLECSLSEE